MCSPSPRLQALLPATGTAWLLVAGLAAALDPPHDASQSIDCGSCHITHSAPGGAITAVAGNPNLCQSCHVVGGTATAFPFVDSDQAAPSPGLPGGAVGSGTSHRWDSGPAGHVEADAGNTSSGSVHSEGAYTGPYPKTYTITVTTTGAVGAAAFSWSDTLGNSVTGLTTGAGVDLDAGVTVTFADGDTSPSFAAGDRWQIPVRTELSDPTDPQMAVRIEDGKIICSTCHDQHSQSRTPWDPDAPGYSGSGSGEGRHFQRIDNDDSAMCNDCHSLRVVTSAALGSHPVGVTVSGGPDYQAPGTLPLDNVGEMVCMTCHQPHYAASTEGTLQRLASPLQLCTDCHTLADVTTPAEHFDTGSSATLWPGGEYGSTFPAILDSGKQGACANCHQAHGWPDAAAPASDFPRLLVDFEENLCYTCHDGSPVSQDVAADFAKASAHPLDQTTGVHDPDEAAVVDSPNRHVECVDCHNAHRATASSGPPGPSTAPRPADGPLTDVIGVSLSGAEVDPAVYEYEVCFRCHADSTGRPAAPTARQFPSTNVREEFDGSFNSFHGVAVVGSNNTTHVASLVGSWSTNSLLACSGCHSSNTGGGSGGSGPDGPHGSIWASLLERRFVTSDPSSYVQSKYALCFKCHSASVILGESLSFRHHNKHINGEDTSCNVCHDPHASSGQRFLINFDTDVVTPSSGRLEFIAPEDSADGRGRCYLVCHGENHSPLSYEPNY